MKPTNPIEHDSAWWVSFEERVHAEAQAQDKQLHAYLQSQPQSKQCPVHDVTLPLDFERSRRESLGELSTAYTPCPQCLQDAEAKREQEFLHRAGVPANLLHATLDNWTPRDKTEAEHLAAVRQFAQQRRGFLVMLGTVGTGKSHLAVGIMRQFRAPHFVKQNTLLRELRRTYRDSSVADPVEVCKEADLLVLDEVGLSGGGRDEFPMLSEIFDYRYCEFLPTVLTGNIALDQLRDFLGERLSDRLVESTSALLTFGGTSQRAKARERYFAGLAQAGAITEGNS